MSDAHVRDEDLDDYVSDLLAEGRRAHLEAHVRICQLCAHKLYRYAQAEEALHELAPRRRASGWARSFAVAAALLAVLAAWRIHVVRSAATPLVSLEDVICPDGDDQGECIRAAHGHGRFV